MKAKFFKRAIAIMIAVVMISISVFGAVAATNDDSGDFIPGSVIVSLKSEAPSVKTLLPDFDIESSRLITLGSSTQNVYLVKFTEKTTEIVLRAIDVLNTSPYVIVAEPDYYQYVDDEVEEIITDTTTQPIESTPYVAEEPKENIIKGDVDGDGRVSIMDATILQRHISGLCLVDDTNLLIADTNGDGNVNIKDVTTIQKYLVGFIDKL
jgi:hypothetical protein